MPRCNSMQRLLAKPAALTVDHKKSNCNTYALWECCKKLTLMNRFMLVGKDDPSLESGCIPYTYLTRFSHKFSMWSPFRGETSLHPGLLVCYAVKETAEMPGNKELRVLLGPILCSPTRYIYKTILELPPDNVCSRCTHGRLAQLPHAMCMCVCTCTCMPRVCIRLFSHFRLFSSRSTLLSQGYFVSVNTRWLSFNTGFYLMLVSMNSHFLCRNESLLHSTPFVSIESVIYRMF